MDVFVEKWGGGAEVTGEGQRNGLFSNQLSDVELI